MIDNDSDKIVDIKHSTGGRKLEITDSKAIIRCNGTEYDARGIIHELKKQGVNVNSITNEQWISMLRGQGTILLPLQSKTLFSIQKIPSGYSIRIVSYTNKTAKRMQNEL